jgi:hypothetical protein
MSNLIPIDMQVPAHLANRVGQPSALGNNLGGGITGGAEFPRISIKASRFRIVDGGTETVLDTPKLDVVIIGANSRLSKSWYETAWTNDGESSAPNCYSLDGVSPHPDSDKPQNDLCASCPQNAWGSRVTQQGTKVKACSDTKRLAVVSADAVDGSMYLLTVTPAALKGLNQYNKELSMRGIPPEIVRTSITFDPSASYPKLSFGFGGFIEPDVQILVDGLFGKDIVADITGDGGLIQNAATPAALPAPVTPVAAAAPIATEPVLAVVPDTPAPTETAAVAGFGGGTVAAAPVEDAAPAPSLGGFGAAATPVAPPVEAMPEPAPAPVVDSATATLAAELSELMAQVDSDDA